MSSTVARRLVRKVGHAVVIGVLATLFVSTSAAAADEPVRYVEPVDAPVIDPYRAPASPYGPGNRGLEYDTSPGQPVHAVAPGVVVFAGQVAGSLHVSVEHADGRRSSYSFVESVAVTLHQRVDRGQVVAAAGERLHVGLREGDVYVDPAAHFGTEVLSIRLVPENPAGGPVWNQTAHEAITLAQLTLFEGGGFGLGDLASGVVGGLGVAGGFLWENAAESAPVLLDVALYVSREVTFRFNPALAIAVFDIAVPLALGRESPMFDALVEASSPTSFLRVVRRGIDWWHHRSDCTSAGTSPPPAEGRRVAVLVAGLDSTSADAAIGDMAVDQLGYAPGDVLGFSYSGGRTPGLFDDHDRAVAADLDAIAVRPYDEVASTHGLAHRGVLLADLLEEVAGGAQGAIVDLYGHSQGGIVVRLALAELASRPDGAATLEALGLVATMGTPHQGSDLAATALVAADSGEGQVLLAGAEGAFGWPVDPDQAPNIADMARSSRLLEGLAAEGLPDGPAYLSLAGRGDLVVADSRTDLDGARQVTLPIDGASTHHRLPSDAATTRELALGLAGLAPTCESVLDFVLDNVSVEGVHALHAAGGVGVNVGDAYTSLPRGVGELVID